MHYGGSVTEAPPRREPEIWDHCGGNWKSRAVGSSNQFRDGHNFVASPKWVPFGHHFAAIAGAGPLVGPTLAAQFGFAPGLLWLLVGAVLAGCVQNFTVLVASVRHRGRSLADIARTEVNPFAGLVTMIAVLFILLVSPAGWVS